MKYKSSFRLNWGSFIVFQVPVSKVSVCELVDEANVVRMIMSRLNDHKTHC